MEIRFQVQKNVTLPFEKPWLGIIGQKLHLTPEDAPIARRVVCNGPIPPLDLGHDHYVWDFDSAGDALEFLLGWIKDIGLALPQSTSADLVDFKLTIGPLDGMN